MFKNCVKIAVRNLVRHKGYSLINIAGLAILLSCMGLSGLASFMAERGTKEIGIRKAFGATVPSIIRLLSKEFVVLVLVANALSMPIAYVLMKGWLQDYSYRADLSTGLFLLAGTAALLIALISVSYQAIRAAVANPVNSLRYE